jgi:hypothetical protein
MFELFDGPGIGPSMSILSCSGEISGKFGSAKFLKTYIGGNIIHLKVYGMGSLCYIFFRFPRSLYSFYTLQFSFAFTQ